MAAIEHLSTAQALTPVCFRGIPFARPKVWVEFVRPSVLRAQESLNMAKGNRVIVQLESSAGTGHRYTTTKNKRTKPDRMEIKKYDPKARKHVPYKETK